MASDESRRRIRDRIAALPENERRQLYKRAANMRRTAQSGRAKPKHRPDYTEWGEDNAPPALEKRKRRHKGSLRQWAESLVEDDDFGTGEPLTVPRPTDQGLVLFATTGQCQVLLASDEVVECQVAPDLAAVQRSDLAVGDRVGIATESDVPTIVEVLPRTSFLSRPDSGPGGRYVERVIAANVDRVVVVAAAKQPPLRTRLLDRYLVAIEHGGADALVAINKVDLLDAAAREELEARLAPYRALGLLVLTCSSTEGTGVADLRAALRGETAVLVGQSGVGKSSLLNALEPERAIATREMSRSNKGRHTTTASTLYRLADGTRIIDTPGVREFGLWQLSRDELRAYFHEFDELTSGCRYRDCSHLHEPDCLVRDAAESGVLPASRYDSYRRLMSTLPQSSE